MPADAQTSVSVVGISGSPRRFVQSACRTHTIGENASQSYRMRPFSDSRCSDSRIYLLLLSCFPLLFLWPRVPKASVAKLPNECRLPKLVSYLVSVCHDMMYTQASFLRAGAPLKCSESSRHHDVKVGAVKIRAVYNDTPRANWAGAPNLQSLEFSKAYKNMTLTRTSQTVST